MDEACKRVGMGTSSAYALRRRVDAHSFRRAWDAALDVAIERLSDAAFARAIKGVATPVFYKGEQVGERVRHDEKLTMFLLRYRDPVRYGAWTDRWRAERAPEDAAVVLADAVDAAQVDAQAIASGEHMPVRAIPAHRRYVAVHAQDVAEGRDAAARPPSGDERCTAAETDAALMKALNAMRPRGDPGADVACGSSTSGTIRWP